MQEIDTEKTTNPVLTLQLSHNLSEYEKKILIILGITFILQQIQYLKG